MTNQPTFTFDPAFGRWFEKRKMRKNIVRLHKISISLNRYNYVILPQSNQLDLFLLGMLPVFFQTLIRNQRLIIDIVKNM